MQIAIGILPGCKPHPEHLRCTADGRSRVDRCRHHCLILGIARRRSYITGRNGPMSTLPGQVVGLGIGVDPTHRFAQNPVRRLAGKLAAGVIAGHAHAAGNPKGSHHGQNVLAQLHWASPLLALASSALEATAPPSHWSIRSAGAAPGRMRPSAAMRVGVPVTPSRDPSVRFSLMGFLQA